MKSMANALIMTSKVLTSKTEELVGELRKVTKEDEESDECELFCTLEDMEQGIDRTIESMDVTIEFLKER